MGISRLLLRPAFAALATLALVATAPAALPTESAKIAELVGQPTGLAVQPETITLSGPRALQQVIVTGKYADGTFRDLTPFCQFATEAPDVAGLKDGLVTPKKN